MTFSFVRINMIFLFSLILCTKISVAQVNNNPCLTLQDLKIVVLGSSTAAGTGVSHPDSAWVNRYRNYLQSINPNNVVINLAIGGFSSYKIMPSGFVPPIGRPSPDTTHNITYGLSLFPDAIIVNLPSNDIASGFSLEEQITNLDSVYSMSLANYVPIWISTTQPKNTTTATMQLQAQMRDSIYAHYGPFAIDFWTTIALPDNSIDPIYDSGDGIHLNDAGHAILVDRVESAGVPDYLFLPSAQPDYAIVDVLSDVTVCGNPNTSMEVVICNFGPNYFGDVNVYSLLQNLSVSNILVDSILISGGLNTCETDTVVFSLNTSEPGIYQAHFNVANQADTNSLNDASIVEFTTIGFPGIEIIHDTLCFPGSAFLEIEHEPGDTVFWYESLGGANQIGAGAFYNPTWVDSSSVWYAEVVRGDLFYRNELPTTISSNIDWNGTMFDLIATETLTIDSFDVKIATAGLQQVQIYFKEGSHKGFELDTNAWTLLDTATIFVNNILGFTQVPIGDLEIVSGDTVGIYIQMAMSTSRLSYLNIPTEIVRTTPELSLITGTGIGHNWTSLYFPRDWNGRVYYHYGFNPQGDCSTGRQPVFAYVSGTGLDLGEDVLIDINQSITLLAPGFISYNWSDGSSSSTLEIMGSDYGVGVHEFSVVAIDSFHCIQVDTILITVDILQSISEIWTVDPLKVYPNPSTGCLHIEVENLQFVQVFDARGKLILKSTNSSIINLDGFSKGLFWVQVNTSSKMYCRKVVLE